MDKIYDLTQKVLLEEMDVVEGLETLNGILENSDQKLQSRSSCVKRIFLCIKDMSSTKNKTSFFDLAGHLRQFILMFQSKIHISSKWQDGLMKIADTTGLYVRSDGEVDIHTDIPVRIPHFEKVHESIQLVDRKVIKAPVGDGILQQMTGFTHYRSAAQKVMVKSCMNMEDGETILAALPTGGGKSLVFLLPAFYETEGGTILGSLRETTGTTIVVVPTVSLAIDQKRSARKFFADALEEKHMPQAYYGDLSLEQKTIIYEGLKEGSLPILFTSPESVVNGSLAKVIEDAAYKGNITRFVIDEAHIVLDWGSIFRTDFQLLSIFQKRLIKATKGKLKTILLSATLTDEGTNLLKKLFCHNEKYTEIRGDELRMEPTFFLDESKSLNERYKKITKLIPFLPRPIIIYVSKKDDAKIWKEKLNKTGYQRVESFTGDTVDSDRERIIRQWNQDEIDIIVATSAFGMGVDKRDIRTVIHCCLPESINRFYQEVGRGGRDGFASISLLSYVYEKDTSVQDGLTSKAVLTTEMVWTRWKAMYETRETTEIGDEFWLHMNSQHEGLEGPSGRRNASLNESVCLMLARHGFIDIIDTYLEEGEFTRKLLVKIFNFSAINDESLFIESLEPDREAERARIRKELRKIRKLVINSEDECFSEYFLETYPYATEACGGCPACHTHRSETTYYPPKLRIPFKYSDITIAPAELSGSLADLSGGFNELILKTENQWDQDSLLQMVHELTNCNISTIILPKDDEFSFTELVKQSSAGMDWVNYTYLLTEELAQFPTDLLKGSVAIFYQLDEKQNDRLFQWSRTFLKKHPFAKIVHVTDTDIYIPSEGKTIDSLLDFMPVDQSVFLEKQNEMFSFEMF